MFSAIASSNSPPASSSKPSPPIAGAISTAICAVAGMVGALLFYYGLGNSPATIAPFLVAYVAGGWGPSVSMVESLRQRKLNVDLLMIVAALGAAAIGDWLEGTVLLFLFSLSGTLEAFAVYRTTRSIEALIQLRPREAWQITDQYPDGERVLVESLPIGCLILVRPGERFPIDGVVTEGESWADESTLTGESVPVHKTIGMPVFAGTINDRGSVHVQMTKAVADTTLERIVHLVQEAQSEKTPTQRFVESWQQPYVIGVFAASLLVFMGARLAHTSDWFDAFYHSMVLLVAASPCAVVVSSPAVMLSAIARAGRMGVLFKGAVHLESLGQVSVIAFDKTGTVTVGKPGVTEVWMPEGIDGSRLLALAAAVERRSEHPLAAPVLEEVARRGVPMIDAQLQDFHSHTGQGVHARIDEVWIGVGREKLFTSHEVTMPPDLIEAAEWIRGRGETALLMIADNSKLYGVIGVADQIRPEAPRTLDALKKLGIERCVILTGDHERVARAIAAQVHADDVRAGLMPEQKVIELRKLAEKGEMIAMIGDGVNDAPALASADVGIAMGGAGTDVALETADVVLMSDDLHSLTTAISISRLARRRVRQNMIFAFSMIGVLVLSTFFDLPLWLGVLGHEGSTVLVVFNGLRLLWEPLPKA